MLIHIGIRPTYPIVDDMEEFSYRKRFKREIYPNGKVRLWSKRMLNSGCKNLTSGEARLENLIYCEHCQEYFSQNQFKDIDYVTSTI